MSSHPQKCFFEMERATDSPIMCQRESVPDVGKLQLSCGRETSLTVCESGSSWRGIADRRFDILLLLLLLFKNAWNTLMSY